MQCLFGKWDGPDDDQSSKCNKSVSCCAECDDCLAAGFFIGTTWRIKSPAQMSYRPPSFASYPSFHRDWGWSLRRVLKMIEDRRSALPSCIILHPLVHHAISSFMQSKRWTWTSILLGPLATAWTSTAGGIFEHPTDSLSPDDDEPVRLCRP